MCDLGGVLGLAAGVASAAGEASTAKKNAAMIQQEAKLEYANQEHQRLVSVDAANKEGYQASLEKDRAVATVRASGEGMGGSTAGLKVAEQQRQGALSIANAKDKVRGANVDFVRQGMVTDWCAKPAQRPDTEPSHDDDEHRDLRAFQLRSVQMRRDELITIELLGSYTCLHVESGLLVDRGDRKNRKSPKSALGPLCRLLIDDGYSPEAKVHIVRKALGRDGYCAVFMRDRSLGAWAGVDCVESEKRSLPVVKHRPLPDAVKGKRSSSRRAPLGTAFEIRP